MGEVPASKSTVRENLSEKITFKLILQRARMLQAERMGNAKALGS